MNIVRYLPSTQFLVIIGSLALSGGLVVAAQYYKNTPSEPSTLAAVTPDAVPSNEWMDILKDIEGENIFATTSATAETTKALLAEATSNNLTNTVARTLLINLADAKSKGFGNDIPTQEKLIAEATTRIKTERGAPAYTEADLTIAADTDLALKTYGNEFIEAFTMHPNASYGAALVAIAKATDKVTPAELGALTEIRQEYKALAAELIDVPVPSKLRMFHLQVANNLVLMSDTLGEVKNLYTDPLRGLASFKLSQGISDELLRLFTNIAQQFVEDGILFNNGEPGSEWRSFLSS